MKLLPPSGIPDLVAVVAGSTVDQLTERDRAIAERATNPTDLIDGLRNALRTGRHVPASRRPTGDAPRQAEIS